MKVKCVAHLAYYMFAAVGVAAEVTVDATSLRLNALEESVTKLSKDNKVLKEENKVLRRNFNKKFTQLDKNLKFKAASIKFLSGDINIVRVDNNVLRDELKQLGQDLEVKAVSIEFLDGDISNVKADNNFFRDVLTQRVTDNNFFLDELKQRVTDLESQTHSIRSDGVTGLPPPQRPTASIGFEWDYHGSEYARDKIIRLSYDLLDELERSGEDRVDKSLDDCFKLKAGKLVFNCQVDFSRKEVHSSGCW